MNRLIFPLNSNPLQRANLYAWMTVAFLFLSCFVYAHHQVPFTDTDDLVLIKSLHSIPNDDCPNPLPITCNQIITGSTVSATPDNPACRGASNMGGGVWYEFIGTGEEVTVSTCFPGTDFDTQLGIFASNCSEPLCVAENDNSPGCGLQSQITFFAALGGSYRILVDGPNGAEGNFELGVFCGNPCENARPLSCFDSPTDNTGGSLFPIAPECGPHPNGRGHWWTFVASGNCHLITTGGNPGGGGLTTDFDTQLSVFQGSCNDLICVAYDDDSGIDPAGSSSLIFHSEPGVRYYVLVHGKGGETGNYRLNHRCYDRYDFDVTCIPSVQLECDQDIPAAATTEAEFEVQGGYIRGGSCLFPITDTYTITSSDNYSGCNNDNIFMTRVYTIRNDRSGLERTCFQFFYCPIEADMEISCPADLTIACDAELPPYPNTLADFEALGGSLIDPSCETGSYFVEAADGTVFGDCFGETIARRYLILNLNNDKVATCTQRITRAPYPMPIITSNGPVTITCVDELTHQDWRDLFSIEFPNPNCEVVHQFRFSFSIPREINCNGAQLTVPIIYQDECGRTDTIKQVFNTVNEGLNITCPPDQTVRCVRDIIVDPFTVDVTHPCFLPYEILTEGPSLVDGDPGFSGAIYEVTYSAKIDTEVSCDELVSCTQRFTIENEGVQITCPVDVTVNCLEDINAHTALVEVVTPCDEDYLLTTSPLTLKDGNGQCSGSVYEITYTATTPEGLTGSCTQLFTLDHAPTQLVKVDPALDTIAHNSTIQIQCRAQDSNWELPRFNVDAMEAIVVCDIDIPVQFELIDEGAADCTLAGYAHRYRYLWWIVDECGDHHEFSFLLELIDNIAPILVGLPADVTVECTETLPEVPEVSATDECHCAYVSFNEFEILSADCSGEKTIVRSWTAKDHCGNTTQANQRISVIDQTAPQLSLVIEGQAILPEAVLRRSCGRTDYPAWLADLNAESIQAFDFCTSQTQATFNNDRVQSYDCVEGYVEKYEPTWTVSDDCGNVSTFSFTVEIYDEVAPSFEGSEILYLCEGADAGFAIFLDDCTSANPSYQDVAITNCGPGVYTRHYTVEDFCGNVAEYEQVLIDLVAKPQLIDFGPSLQPTGMTFNCNGDGKNYSGLDKNAVVKMIDCIPAKDLEISVSENLLASPCDNGGAQLQLLWTATSPCGYIDSLQIMAEIIDNEVPYFINFIPELELACGDELPRIEAADDCGEVAMVIEEEIVSDAGCANERTVRRIITITDACGKSTTQSQLVHFVDQQGPVFDVPSTVCKAEASESLLAFDACSQTYVVAELIAEDILQACSEGKVVARTWRAIDKCGNVSEFTQTIYPDNFEVEYLIADRELEALLNGSNPNIYASELEKLDLLERINQLSVMVQAPCGEWMLGEFSRETEVQEECRNGWNSTLRFRWFFLEYCGKTYEYEVEFYLIDDLAPRIDLGEDQELYCTEEIPPLSFSEEAGVDYQVTTNDQRDALGDGLVSRTVRAQDACGNTSVATINYYFYNSSDLSCTIQGDFEPDCNSGGNVYTVYPRGGTAPYQINWQVVEGNCVIQHSSGTSAEIYVGYGQATIMAEVIDANGCVSQCEAIIDCRGLGIASESTEALLSHSTDGWGQKLGLNLFPNPFRAELLLQFTNAPGADYQITVTDQMGRLVHREKRWLDGDSDVPLDLGKLESGIYQVMVVGAEQVRTLRVIKLDAR